MVKFPIAHFTTKTYSLNVGVIAEPGKKPLCIEFWSIYNKPAVSKLSTDERERTIPKIQG